MSLERAYRLRPRWSCGVAGWSWGPRSDLVKVYRSYVFFLRLRHLYVAPIRGACNIPAAGSGSGLDFEKYPCWGFHST